MKPEILVSSSSLLLFCLLAGGIAQAQGTSGGRRASLSCVQAAERLLPLVTFGMTDRRPVAGSYELEAPGMTAEVIRERVSAYKRQPTPDWDYAWVKDKAEAESLRRQTREIHALARRGASRPNAKAEIEALTTYLQSPSEAIQAVATAALGNIRHPEAALPLLQFRPASPGVFSTWTVIALGSLDYTTAPEIRTQVEDFLAADLKKNWLTVLPGLVIMKSERVWPFLAELTSPNRLDDEPTGWNTIRALITLDDVRAVPMLRSMIENGNDERTLFSAVMGLAYYSRVGKIDPVLKQELFAAATKAYVDRAAGTNGEPLIALVVLRPSECDVKAGQMNAFARTASIPVTAP